MVQPTRLSAGDTWAWDHADATYPATAGYTLSLAINGPGQLVWAAGYVTVVGAVYQITIAATATAALPAGVYTVTAVYTKGAERYSRALGRLVVLANPATLAPGETQSWAEQTLAVVEARIAGRVDDDIVNYSIQGRSVGLIPMEELFAMRNRLVATINRRRRGGKRAVTRAVFVNE